MQTKKLTVLLSVVFLTVGILIGKFVFGANTVPSMNHDSMTNTMSGMTDSLEGKTGNAFDEAFIEGMITHHEGAVAMAEMALVSAEHQEIKDMATAIISAQTKEIDQMKEWKKNWYTQ